VLAGLNSDILLTSFFSSSEGPSLPQLDFQLGFPSPKRFGSDTG